MAPWNPRANNVFLQALEICDLSARAVFVEEVCRGEPDVQEHVRSLLDASGQTDNLLDRPVVLSGATGRFVAAAEGDTTFLGSVDAVGTRVGPYKLLELIGEGGMGAVYLARQTEPVKRLVAVKLIKAGMDSRQVLTRFEAERQALALMDHPNIAKVLDGGVVGVPASAGDSEVSPKPVHPREGRPYFVMEMVKGMPITKFCDEHKLTPRERLELFLPICLAIQHAHQKGIIHRDIKPSNVVVALYDGKPVPKVIDFGVAKAMGQPLTERTMVTGLGAVVGTPEYMSPEQAELNQLDIDTRSDIYSLGVLLYELLTGTTPLTKKRMKDSALLEVLRVIREEEPQKPSTRLSTADELPSIAANRGVEPARLSRMVRGEIDWIVMKALEKDRSRRYETANGFAADVRRYLAGEAVQAVPPSVGYRLRKLARRNKRALVTSVFLLGMLFILVGGLGWVVSDRAAQRKRTAFEVGQFLQRAESLYAANKLPEAKAEVQKAHGVLGTAGGDEELRRRVQKRLTELETAVALEEIQIEFSGPVASDRVYAEYSRLFQNYGIDVEALSNEEAADRIAQSNIKLDLVLALDRWAKSLRSDERRLDPARWQKLQLISRAADSDPWRQRYNAAAEAGDSRTLRELADEADLERMRTRVLAALGDALRKAKDVEASVAFLRKAQKRYPADYSINASLGWSLRSLETPLWDEAIAFRRIAVAVRPQSSTANFYLGYSLHYHAPGKLDEAKDYYRTAIELDSEHAPAHYCLAQVFRVQGKPQEALLYFRKTKELLPTDPNPLNGLAWELATSSEPTLRDPAQAVALAKEAVKLSIGQGDEPDRLGNYWGTLGVAHYRAGQMEEALTALEQSLKVAGRDEKRYVCENWYFLAMVHAKLDLKGEACRWYDLAVEWTEKKEPKDEELRRFRAEAEELLSIEKKE